MKSLTELRKYRFLSLSAIDLFGTIIIALFLLYILSKSGLADFNIQNIIIINLSAIILGIIVHKVLNVKTQLNYYLNLGERPVKN